jgi:light-regulated signal transduction histidine kinase (bacteriophytochrome)
MMIEKPSRLLSVTLAIRTGWYGTLLAIIIRSGATVIALDDAVGLKRLVDVEWNGEKMLMFADDLQGNRIFDPSVGRREPEQVLIEHSLDLARSNEELERFAFAVAHDLREPLRSIEAMTQLFLERNKRKLDTDSAHLLDFVVNSAERMKRLIHDLLEFAVVSHRFEAIEVDAQAVVEIAVQQLQEAIDQSGATVAIEALPLISANGDLLLRLFQNLIMNAIKYAGEGPPVIHISSSTSDSETVFCVKDNGIGIDPKYHQQIFDPFRRLHTASEHEGTGIGLATCKRIVEQHSGRIWVESQPGEGSKFLFAIPKVTMGSSEKKATRKPNQDNDPSKHDGRAAAG